MAGAGLKILFIRSALAVCSVHAVAPMDGAATQQRIAVKDANHRLALAEELA